METDSEYPTLDELLDTAGPLPETPFTVRPGITAYDNDTWRIQLSDGSTITGTLVEDRYNTFGPEACFYFLMDVKSGAVFGSTRLVLVRSTNMSDRYKVTA